MSVIQFFLLLCMQNCKWSRSISINSIVNNNTNELINILHWPTKHNKLVRSRTERLIILRRKVTVETKEKQNLKMASEQWPPRCLNGMRSLTFLILSFTFYLFMRRKIGLSCEITKMTIVCLCFSSWVDRCTHWPKQSRKT